MNRVQVRWIVRVFGLLAAWGSQATAGPPEPRFTAVWEDDTRLSGELSPWYQTPAQPELAGRPLFNPQRTVVWLQDNRQMPAREPEAWVEMWGWDFLPGKTIGCRPRLDGPNLAPLPHLIVIPDGVVERPGQSATTTIRVPLRWVRRVVWQRMVNSYRPATLFLRDGRQIAFRAARLAEDVVRLLRDDGVEEFPLAAVAELHLAPSDGWETYFEQLAALSLASIQRWVQVETAAGLRASASPARFQADRSPADDNPEHWYHLVQPAWSLDPMWLPYRQIRVWRFFTPSTLPLSWLAPSAVRRQAILGGAWQWRADRNVQGGRLRSGGQVYQWGFGVHATCELEFPLHPTVRAFRTRLGLDALVSDGGSVRAEAAELAGARRVLYESRLLVGSAQTLDTGWQPLHPAADSSSRLLLRVAAAQGEGPARTDPLDIRDIFDWLEPTLKLDDATLRAEVLRCGPRLLPAWREWSVTSGTARGAVLESRWNIDPDRPRYRLAAVAPEGTLRLARQVRVPPNARLTIAVGRPAESPASRIAVLVNDKPRAEFEVPAVQPRQTPAAQEVSLVDFAGQTVSVEVLQRSPNPAAVVFWERLDLESQSTPAPGH